MSKYSRSAIQSQTSKLNNNQINNDAVIILKHFFNNNINNKKKCMFNNLKYNANIITKKQGIFRQILQSISNRKIKSYNKQFFSKIQSEYINSLSTQIQAQTKAQNLQQEQYKRLQLELTSLKNQNQSVINEFKYEIQQLNKNNSTVLLNLQEIQMKNQLIESQIFQQKLKCKKNISMTQIWEQIYRNFAYFLFNNQNKTLLKEQILQNLQIPFINLDNQNLIHQNQILQELLNQYINAGMAPTDIDSICVKMENGKVDTNQLSYDIILKTNKYFYDVVTTLIEKGLGNTENVDSLKAQLQTLAYKEKK